MINCRVYQDVQRAKDAGKYRGRKHCVDKNIRKEFVEKLNSNKYTSNYLAKMARVPRSTLYNWKRELEVRKDNVN